MTKISYTFWNWGWDDCGHKLKIHCFAFIFFCLCKWEKEETQPGVELAWQHKCDHKSTPNNFNTKTLSLSPIKYFSYYAALSKIPNTKAFENTSTRELFLAFRNHFFSFFLIVLSFHLYFSHLFLLEQNGTQKCKMRKMKCRKGERKRGKERERDWLKIQRSSISLRQKKYPIHPQTISFEHFCYEIEHFFFIARRDNRILPVIHCKFHILFSSLLCLLCRSRCCCCLWPSKRFFTFLTFSNWPRKP